MNILKHTLENLGEDTAVYIPNPGNAGDKMISRAAFELFAEIDLQVEMGHPQAIYSGRALIYGGGGNLVGAYKDCHQFLHNNQRKNRIIVLPQTITNEDELLSELGNNVHIFCREPVSHEYVIAQSKHPENIYLVEDLALNLSELDKWKKSPGNGICHCFRTDRERTQIALPSSNIDIAVLLNTAGEEQAQVRACTDNLFALLSQFEVIKTNRLHMAIAGCLLGKQVHFYRNSYFKNEAIYRYSLAPRFGAQITLCEEEESQENQVILADALNPVDPIDFKSITKLIEELQFSDPAMALQLSKLLMQAKPSRREFLPLLLNSLRRIQ